MGMVGMMGVVGMVGGQRQLMTGALLPVFLVQGSQSPSPFIDRELNIGSGRGRRGRGVKGVTPYK